MADKVNKMSRTKGEMEKLKRRAKSRFLEGSSIAQINRELDVSRNTLTKWRDKEEWAKQASAVEQEVDTRIRKQAVTNLFDQLEPEYKEVANNIRVLNNIVSQQIWKRDTAGRVLRDESGKPIVNDKLKPKDIRHLSMIMASNLKTMRLLMGESTENIDQKNTHSGEIDHNLTHGVKGPIDELVEKMESGEIDVETGQELLGKLAINLQQCREVTDNG